MIIPSYSFSQELGERNSESPIEISAENSLEWIQAKKKYMASGDVVVTQDDLVLKTDQLTAFYENEDSNTDITEFIAVGNVIIENTDSVIVGDKAVYNLLNEEITVTGNNLKLTNNQDVLTADESMTYNVKTGIAKAKGNANITSGENQIQAPMIEGRFVKSDNDEMTLSKATATGGVKITTKDEVITGNIGTFSARNDLANISGNVVITRGPNRLEGDRAQVNLKTNISQIFADKKTNQRVKGVFFPKENSGS